MGSSLQFDAVSRGGIRRMDVNIDHLIIAGWTGRDPESVEHHIRELEKLGVPRPSRTPMFYRISNHLLTHAPGIQLMGEDSSGEAEIVLLDLPEGRWVGVGSDHTDRTAEIHGITLAKQVCAKPIGRTVWRYEEVAGHWDSLVVRSHAWQRGERRLYQEGTAGALLHPDDLMRLLSSEQGVNSGSIALFLGTFAAIGGISPAERFDFELEDPVLGRRIEGSTAFLNLAIAG